MSRTKSRRPTPQRRTRVSFADADRVRRHLLSDSVQVLNTKDITTILRIINDVYPANGTRSRATTPARAASRSRWQPLLVGIGIGIVLLVLAMSVV